MENKKEKFQGQEFDDELGLSWYQFRWRNHDPQIGRFIEIDPLSEKYLHNSVYSFSENKVISHIELEGLEGVRFDEIDKNGSPTGRTIIEKNIVLLVPPEEKEKDRIRSVAELSSELNDFFNGQNGNGTAGPDGKTVYFKFNIFVVDDKVDKKKSIEERNKEYKEISLQYGIEGEYISNGEKQDRIVGAAIFTREQPNGGAIGRTNGDVIKISEFHPAYQRGTKAHEVSHTLGTSDNDYKSGGILESPPNPIISEEIQQILRHALEKKK